MGYAILSNDKMLTWWEKLRTGAPLVPMLVGGQEYIDAQDELSVQQWMRKNFMPERVREELFIAMGKALDFIDSDKLLDDGDPHRHEPFHQRDPRVQDGVLGRKPARSFVRAHGGARGGARR